MSPHHPQGRAGNIGRGLRSLRDLTQHLTTRADDSHAPPVHRQKGPHLCSFPVYVKPRSGSSRCIELIRMLRRLCGPPSIPLSFSLAAVLPRRGAYCVSYGTETVEWPPHLAPNVYGVDYQGI